MIIDSRRRRGKEIEEHLSSMNMDPWYYIYENYIQNDSIQKLNQRKKESND